MIILPAIDLLGGQCVRLVKGEYSTASAVADSVIDTAVYFKRCGAQYIHMVDLDGAKNGEGSVKNRTAVAQVIKETGLPVELGGGIRTLDDIRLLADSGVSRIILGSAAADIGFVNEAVRLFGERIAVGIDAKNGFAALSGWTKETKLHYLDFAKSVADAGVTSIIFTDISKDGTLSHPNFDMLSQLQKKVNISITASGGIKDIDDIKTLCGMELYGAICGKSIYAGTLDLKEAINACKTYNSVS